MIVTIIYIIIISCRFITHRLKQLVKTPKNYLCIFTASKSTESAQMRKIFI